MFFKAVVNSMRRKKNPKINYFFDWFCCEGYKRIYFSLLLFCVCFHCLHCAATADDGVQRSNNFDGRKTRLIPTWDPWQQLALPPHVLKMCFFPSTPLFARRNSLIVTGSNVLMLLPLPSTTFSFSPQTPISHFTNLLQRKHRKRGRDFEESPPSFDYQIVRGNRNKLRLVFGT